MDTKALRQKILDLAIRGKLVPQDPNDEPASVLLEHIREEKERLIKEGKIKRSKKTATTDTPHHGNIAPFEIPDSWVWVKLEDICDIKGGKRIPKGKSLAKYKTSHVYLRVADLKNRTVSDDDIQYIDDEVHSEIRNYIINSSDLYLTVAGSIGRVGNIPEKYNGANLTENADKLTNIKIDKQYLLLAIDSQFVQEQFAFKYHQVAQPKLSIETICVTYIPMPSLAEQKRIVAEVEHWFALIDEVESDKADLESLISQAKSKILSLAIQGKLVEQDPADEPASELLRRVNPSWRPDDKSHYQILPNGWVFSPLEECTSIIMGQSPESNSYNEETGVEFHQGKLLFTDFLIGRSKILTDSPKKLAKPYSVILSVRAPVGAVNMTDRIIAIGRGLCAIKPYSVLNLEYLYYWFISNQESLDSKSTGTTFKAISIDVVKNELVPIPPLNEQERIVDRINTLFRMLNEIGKLIQ